MGKHTEPADRDAGAPGLARCRQDRDCSGKSSRAIPSSLMERRNFIKGAAPLAAAAATPFISTAEGKTGNPLANLTENLNPDIQKAREAAMAVLKP